MGATGATYVPVVADVGRTLRVRVSASNVAGGPVVADSVQTAAVVAAAALPPVNEVLPLVSGVAQVGLDAVEYDWYLVGYGSDRVGAAVAVVSCW